MSLKAKLEAVIYASEEPVTLTQLASLFAAEALEWKAAQAAAAAEQSDEVAGEIPLPLEPQDQDGGVNDPAAEPAPVEPSTAEEAQSELATEPAGEAASESAEEEIGADASAQHGGAQGTSGLTAPQSEAAPNVETASASEPAEPPSSPEDVAESLPAEADTAEPAQEEEAAAEVSSDQAPVTEPTSVTEPALDEEPQSDEVAEPESEQASATGLDAAPDAAQPEAPVDPEAEAKRLARLRDREVKSILKQLLDELIAAYTDDDHGVEIREIAGGYRMATKPACHDAVRLFVKSLKPPLKLSLPALETLAVVAYKQPITAPEVSEIRGVESGGVLGSLLSRKLIATAGRKQVIGRPILYKTTKEFLLRFGLKDLNELPSMEEFEKMAGIEIEQEMEPEALAADAAQDAAEAAEAAREQAELAANSPSGEEMAEAEAEITGEAPATETPASQREEDETPAQEPSTNHVTEAASAEPEPQEEIEATPHAEEDQEER